MQQFLKGKILSVVFMILVGLVLLSGVFFAVYGSMHRNASFYEKMYMFLDGEYSVDGGDWKPIDPWSYSPIQESFRTVTFRGKPIEAAEGFDNILIFSKNVWYTLSAEDGTVLKHHVSTDIDEDFDVFYSHIDAEFRNEDMKNLWYETMSRYRALQYHLLQTPGYRYTSFASGQLLSEDSLKQTAPVPFSRELEHLKKYLYIEKMRFDDMLNIKYDIQTEDFDVPRLSVQPLVENAVKHGVGMKEDGGTVTIATRETETAYEIIISDDGVGFDTSASKKEDGRSHIGMESTRKRLKDMCNADIVTESTPGEGTTVRVIIPKKTKEEPEP